MTKDLIINPFAEIAVFRSDEKSGLDITVPVPNKAKSYFRLESDSEPDLVEYISDLTNWGLDQFKPEDLTAEEQEPLVENGFLVDKNLAPQKPLFHFFLDEIEPENDAPISKDLTVNPSFRLEPFDLDKVPHLIKTNNFSPDYPIAWIKLPITEIEVGYWLRNEYAEIAQKFVAGEKLSYELNENLLSKLVAADILINPAERQIREAKIKRRRFYEHNLSLARFFHREFTKLMSIIAGLEVKPSYVYSASYVEEAALDPHTDRAQCEYSISFQVDYQSEPENDVSPWGLYVSPVELANPQQHSATFPWEDYSEDDPDSKKSKKANLKSGDSLFYLGRKLVHYRYPLAKGHKSTSLFFHYVAKDFEGELN